MSAGRLAALGARRDFHHGLLATVLVLIGSSSTARAQDAAAAPPAHDHQADAAAPAWQWHVSANTFFGLNYQQRKFTDFDEWESQNWVMASAEGPVSDARVRFSSMFSLEPFTMRDIGSPQVFQTGETFRRGALVDYQHPHDLIMGLGGEVRMPAGRATALVGVDIVGSPTLGPPVFMHRPSAIENPQAPLSHHHLDSTHITPGVIRGGLEAGPWRFEGSWFQGREPDENRTDLDLGALDSYAVRVAWTRGRWSAQASTGWLTKPEAVTPYDSQRVTGSISYFRGDERSSLAWLAAFGQNREIHGNLEAYLFEATLRASERHAFYTRLESAAKDILDVGFHPVGTFHRHRQSQVGALTLGYVRDLWRPDTGVFGVGGDVTGYAVPPNLKESYGSPVSFHVFLRYRGKTPGAPVHVH